MAGYTALIDLRVGGLDGLKKATDSLASINNLIKQIKPVPTLFDQRTGGGTEQERAAIQAAKTALSGLVKAYADGDTRVAKFSTSMAGLSNQMRHFNAIAGNATIGSEEFVDGIVAAERASRKLTAAEYDRLRVLRNIYTAEKTGGRTTTTAAEEVLKRGRKVLGTDTSGLKSSIAELEFYQAEIEAVFETVSQGTPVFRELQQALAAVNKELTVARGMGAMQGPALPGGFTEQGARSGTFPSSPIRGGVGMKGSPLAKDAQRKMLENVLIGGGFPMLFGGGAGAVLGGAAGGLIPGNPMLSIVTSALGTVVDQFAAAATEMGASLRDPITNFEKLKEANLFASKTQEFYIQKLIETGRITEATGAIQARVASIIGNTGVQSLQELGAETAELGRLLGQLTLLMQAAIAGPLTALIAKMNEILGVKVSGDKAQNTINQLFEEGSKEAGKQLAATVNEITRKNAGNAPKIIAEIDSAVAKAQKSLKPDTSKIKLDPAAQEQAIKAAEQQADIIKGAYRTGFQLQQQAIDLQRQGTDLQRRVADDIFNKQQQIARLQIDNERQRQQIAIETVDLEYRRRISQEEGRVAEALAAEADLLKTRAQGEANIGNAKRLLELDIAKQQRDTENYVYQLGREIENIRRSTLNYEMQVADYRLDIERKVAAERRTENAGVASGSIPSDTVNQFAASAFPGQTTSKQGSFPAYIPKEKLRAFLESQGFGRTGGDFTNAGHKTPNHMLNAMDMGILGGSDANALRRTSEMEKKLRATGAFGNQLFGPISDPYGHGAGKGGQNIHLHIPTPGGKVKMTAKLNDLMQGKGGFTSSTTSQLTTAGSQVTARPDVPSVDAGAVGATQIALNAKDAAIRKEAVTIQQNLNNLAVQAAEQRLLEVSRGSIDIKQREDAVKYAQAELNLADKTNSELAEQLALEAQSGVKRAIRKEEDKQILANLDTAIEKDRAAKKDVTALLQTRKNVAAEIEKGVLYTEKQIELDKQLLTIAQQLRFEKEEAALQAQLGVTGTGLQAGFVGAAGSAFESGMIKSGGNTEQATRLAELTNQLTLAQVQAQGMESSVLAIGDAFGTAMTSGVASLIAGTATAEQVFAQFLDTIAQALLQAAAKMIATYIAIAIAKAIAGMSGGGGGGTMPGAAPQMTPGAVVTPTGFQGQFAGIAANGATFANGVATFAKGGAFTNSVVSSPTMFKFADGGAMRTGLMGEAGPEAIMPLSRGADGSLGVQANGLREAMDRQQGGTSGSPVLNMSFQSTSINGVEYVSREQLESAMAETRRASTRDGAKRGMTMTLDRIQNSSSTRRRAGI